MQETDDLIAIDFEAGGLDARTAPALALGAVFRDETFHRHLLPPEGMTVQAAAAQVNGYSPERWQSLGAVTVEQAQTAFCAWWDARKKEGARRMLAHNAVFDSAFLSAFLPPGESAPRWECSQCLFAAAQRAGVLPRGSTSLDALCLVSGFQGRRDPHDALVDATASLHGYTWLLKKISPSHV